MGKDLNFMKVLAKLEMIHSEHPDLRFGEVVQSAVDKYKRRSNVDLHDVTSKHLLSMLTGFDDQTRLNKEIIVQRKIRKLDQLKKKDLTGVGEIG